MPERRTLSERTRGAEQLPVKDRGKPLPVRPAQGAVRQRVPLLAGALPLLGKAEMPRRLARQLGSNRAGKVRPPRSRLPR